MICLRASIYSVFQVRVAWRAVGRRYGHELDQVREETVRLREALERTAPLEDDPSPQPRPPQPKGAAKAQAGRPPPRPPAPRKHPAAAGPKGEPKGEPAIDGPSPAADLPAAAPAARHRKLAAAPVSLAATMASEPEDFKDGDEVAHLNTENCLKPRALASFLSVSPFSSSAF